ncbi:MAG: radical SAM protein [Candidatus Sumerlaeia bacterium]|nr:radical SAM protein [Candidatus Sumerlaeia bacterium]
MPRILFVNPWATDFSAFDLWARPLGLLYLAAVARCAGCEPFLLDCMDRHHPSLAERPWKPRRFACGKYPAQVIEKPPALRQIPRRFKRYGIALEDFERALDALDDMDLICVGSRMAYWYPGAVEAIRRLRRRFPRAPIALGGIYATLFPDHARRESGADFIIEGEGENALLQMINDRFRPSPPVPLLDLDDLDALPPPAYDLLSSRDCLPVMLTRGCPHRCTYCASRKVFGRFRQRDPVRAAEELIRILEQRGDGPECDVAFYDDALLADADRHFLPFCRRLIAARSRLPSALRFHTPNGLDFSVIRPPVAHAMAEVGFRTVRLSIETADRTRLRALNRCADLAQFESALQTLAQAGFAPANVGVYVLFGLPEQTRSEVEQTIDYVLSLGAVPLLGEFSPMPFTAEWEKVRRMGNPPVESEPLLTNNSVFYRLGGEFPDSWVNDLRQRIREAMRKATIPSALEENL